MDDQQIDYEKLANQVRQDGATEDAAAQNHPAAATAPQQPAAAPASAPIDYNKLARDSGAITTPLTLTPGAPTPPVHHATQQQYDQGFTQFAQTAAKYAPGTLAAIGGLTQPEFWPAVAYTGIGALLGSGVNQGVQLATGSPEAPKSPGEAALRLGQDVAEQEASEIGGRAVAKPFEILANLAKGPATRMYQRALAPNVGLRPAEAEAIAKTGVSEGIPVSSKGYWKVRGKVDDLNTLIQQKIDAESQKLGAVIDPEHVADYITARKPEFQTQALPETDLAELGSARAEFLRQHTTQAPFTTIRPIDDEIEAQISGAFTPTGKGSTPIVNPMTLSEAQALKQGTYRRLRGSYGELSFARKEAAKSLAYGLRQDIVAAFPEIAKLNAKDSALIDLEQELARHAVKVTDADAGGNFLVGGVAAASGGNIGAAAALHALYSAYKNPVFRSKLAIAMYRAAKTTMPRKALTLGLHEGASDQPLFVNPPKTYAPQFAKGGLVRCEELDRLSRRGVDRSAVLRSLGA